MGKIKKAKKSVAKPAVLPSTVKRINHLNAKNANYSGNVTNGKSVFGFSGAANRNSSVNSVDTEAINGGNGVSADLHIDLDSVDHSIIREPINIGVKNVRQIMSCVNNGTSEVKDIILNECNIIYECKICLNLFRSLPNLIAHKRVYCKKHYCEQMVLFDSTVLQFNDDEEDICEEHDVEDEEVFVEEPSDSGNGTSIDFVSPVSSIQTTNSNENVENQKRKFIDNCCAKVAKDKQKEEQTNDLELKLSSIKTNSNAVFQSRINGEKSCSNDSDKSVAHSENRKDIIHELLKEAKIDKTSYNDMKDINDIQALKRQRLDDILSKCSDSQDDMNAKSIVKCEICDSTFTSTKTFKVHFRTIHSNNRLIYPCPLCSLTFKQLSNATRHIIQIHKRTKTQSNSLREVMRRRAYYTNSSGNSSEVEDVSEEDIDNEDNAQNTSQTMLKYNDETMTKINMQLIENGSDKSKEKPKSATRINAACIYKCGNVFNWAPAKRSHEKSCRKRFASNDDLVVKRENQTNGNSIPSSDTHHSSRSTPPPPPLIKQNSFSTESIVTNENIFHSSVVNVNSSNSIPIIVPNPGFHSVSNHNSSSSSTATSTSTSTPATTPTTTTTSTTTTTTTSTNIILPNRVEEQIKQFTEFKSLQCTLCPTQDFMNLNHLVQHAVAHIGYNVFRCHGCSFHSIVENDMKSHLKNNHNIGEDMLSKHYQTLPTLNQPRLLIVPVKAKKSINGPNSNSKPIVPLENVETSNNRDQDSKLLKIHLRTMGNTSKKIYEIVDK